MSTRSAKASGIDQLSAVQRATAESIASKARLDEEKHALHHSKSTSPTRTVQDPVQNPSPAPPNSDDLVELTYKAAELSEAQTTSILEQLYGDGFEWGLSTDVDVMSPEEPCSLAEALNSPDAPKWLAACREELDSIKQLKVF